MNPITRDAGTPRVRVLRAGRRLTLCLIALIPARSGAPLAAQAVPGTWSGQPTFGMWAAQTGPDQVSLAWDSIPGVTGYQVWVGPPDPLGGRSPALSLGPRARQSVLFGVDRLAAGLWLVARGANGSLQQAQFNPVVREWGVQVMAPAQVTATATSPTEVTLSWSQVGGATGYSILRSISPGGLVPLCALCSTTPTYVDHSAIPGGVHSYSVSAIFPNGVSKRTTSNPVTPGVTPAPTPTTGTSAPTTTSWSTATSYDSATGRTTTTTTRTICTTTAPITCSSNVTSVAITNGPAAGGSTSSPPATSPAPAPAPSTPPTTSSTPSTGTGAPAPTAPQTVGGVVGGVIVGVAGALNTAMGTLAGPANVTATVTGPGAVRVSWQASPTSSVKSYLVSRRINGGSLTFVDSVAASVLAYSDVMFPTTLFGGGAVQVSYEVVASTGNVTSRGTPTGVVTVQSPGPVTSTATVCKLDYQRADNMWAAFGRPDGPLGTETISLAQAQDKVFVTDWKYEKQRNDGSNFYGSHLRIATNPGTRTVRLQLRTLTLTGLLVWVRTGADTFWMRLGPGQSLPFQADLMEVYCE